MRKCCRLLPLLLLLLLLCLCFPEPTFGGNDNDDGLLLLDFMDDFGGIPFDSSPSVCQYNSNLLSSILTFNASQHRLRFATNFTFYFHYGIHASHVNNVIIQIDGILRFQRHHDNHHHYQYYPFPACIAIEQSRNVTLTSSAGSNGSNQQQQQQQQQRGMIDGQGAQWWGIPLLGYLQTVEHRPRLLRFNLTQDLLIEHLIFIDSPYHTIYLDTVNGVEIRHISIVARRIINTEEVDDHDPPVHDLIDLSAFNTDGIDVSGHNVWVHDCDIWVQDDCIAVKDHGNHSYLFNHLNNTIPTRQQHQQHYVSSNMTFERINATGLGFVIGSILGTHVKNITFRNNYLYKSVKGIYLKFATPTRGYIQENLTALVENILYENITIQQPSQWPIWIGPAQQADARNPCHGNPCSLCWPMIPGAQCNVVPFSKFRNITLKNIFIYNPQMSPGAFVGDDRNPIDDIVLDTVRVIITNNNNDEESRRLSNLFANPQSLYETFPGLYHLPPTNDPYVPKVIGQVQLEMTRLGNKISDWHAMVDTTIRRQLNHITTQLTTTLVHLDQQQQQHDQGGGGGGTNRHVYLAYVLVHFTLMALDFWIWEFIAACFALFTFYLMVRWIQYCKRQRRRQRRCSTEEEQAEEEDAPLSTSSQVQAATQTTTPLVAEEQITAITTTSTTITESSVNQISTISMTRSSTTRTILEPVVAASREEHDLATWTDAASAKNSRCWPACVYHVGFFGMILFTTTVTLHTFSFPLQKPKWKQSHEYFVCQGVVRGVAKGQTWPIPDCFEHDKRQSTTDASAVNNSSNNNHDSQIYRHSNDHQVTLFEDVYTHMLFASFISFAIIVMALCLALCVSAVRQRRCRLTCSQRRTGDEETLFVAVSLTDESAAETLLATCTETDSTEPAHNLN